MVCKEVYFWLLCSIIVFLFTNNVFAEDSEVEDTPYEEDEEGQGIVDQTDIVIRNGVSGIWFPMSIAREVLSDVRELPLLRRQISLLDEQLTLRERQLDRVNQSLEHERSAREVVMGEVEAMQERVERAERRERAVWRSPVLWFVIGSVCTIALVVAGAAILKSVQPSLIYSVD